MVLTGLDRAILIVGSGNRLAEEVGVTHQAVSKWRKRGFVPFDRAKKVSEVSGVPVLELVSPKYVALFVDE